MIIGFIGLGNMGAPMASNLAAAGHDVIGFDVAGTTAQGVRNTDNIADAVNTADAVITMLPNGAILRAVTNEILPAMKSGAVHIDCSTVDVDSARALSTSTVEQSICTAPDFIAGNISLVTARKIAPFGNMVITASAVFTASAMLSVLRTPCAVVPATSKPITSWPAAAKLDAIGAPIFPSPIKPMIIVQFLCRFRFTLSCKKAG